MAKPREPWNIRPTTKRVAVAASIKAEVEAKANDLIERVLKPKYVLPPKKDEQFNYITDIGAKWHGNYFTSSRPTPAQARMPSRRHSSRNSLGWSPLVVTSLPSIQCAIPERNGLAFTTLFRSTSA